MQQEVFKKWDFVNVSETNIISIFLNKIASGKTEQDMNEYGRCN